uniref:Small ribosomal subunit protein mS26 n=1 Tax=Timema californicum TaxID=61474 RepID=A0A7R9P2R1_TIMCA|nr:unnamed protein product [Timema californicum]
MFRVPVRPKIPKEEKDELCRLHNIYRTYFSALRHYLSQEYEKNINQYTGLVDIGGQDSEHEDCMRINAEWNAEVAAEREERLVRQGEERKKIILETLIAAEKRQQERAQKADEIVRKEKINSKTFITAENIDKAIEDALATETDHNYAIDLEGNVYRGRYSKPTVNPPEEREKLEVKAEATA